MKKNLSLFIILIMLINFLFVAADSQEVAEPKCLKNLRLYINDQLMDCQCYENENNGEFPLPDSTKDFIPLRASLEALGCSVEWKESSNIIIRTEKGRNIYMIVNENDIEYCFFRNEDFSFLNEPWHSARVSMDYINVDGSIYYPMYEFPNIVGCYLYRDGDSIYLDSESYYNEHHIVYENIGRKVNVSAYINDKKIDTPVYYNTSFGNTRNFFVELRTVFDTLGFDVEFIAPNIIIVKNNGEQYEMFRAKASYGNGYEVSYEYGLDDCYIVDGKTYISFTKIRYMIDGSLKQTDENNMYLYTKDFDRKEIPNDLIEAYKYFDENLSDEDIEYIKNGSVNDLASLHFSLGLWIRNNWIYPFENKIAKVFTDKGIDNPDNISGFIIYGYKLYLNELPCEIDALMK